MAHLILVKRIPNGRGAQNVAEVCFSYIPLYPNEERSDRNVSAFMLVAR